MVAVKLNLYDYGPPINYVRRDEWGALPPQVPEGEFYTEKLMQPIFFVRLTQTSGRSCEGTMECYRVLQDLQAEHIHAGATDINYNFMITGYCNVFEGRGWDKGAHRPNVGDSTTCVDIAYVGTFDKDNKPPWDIVSTALDFIKYSIKKKHISPQFRIV